MYQRDLEERVQLLTQSEATLTAEFKRQAARLESQFTALKAQNAEAAAELEAAAGRAVRSH